MVTQSNCLDCKHLRTCNGRGLCSVCYQYHHNHHTLDKFPRSTWKNEDLMAELDFFRRQGLSVREAAEKIGVSLSALRKAIERAQQRAKAAVGPETS